MNRHYLRIAGMSSLASMALLCASLAHAADDKSDALQALHEAAFDYAFYVTQMGIHN